jgi:peptidoglycan/xylan/chitin deacetylase (PgdA/CDA1 family)
MKKLKKRFLAVSLLSLLLAAACSTSTATPTVNKPTPTAPVDSASSETGANTTPSSPTDVNTNTGTNTTSDNTKPGTDQNQDKEDSNSPDLSKSQDAAKYYVDSVYRIRPVEQADSKQIALLTFDDTPYGETTYEILDLLDAYNAKAIFFINGHLADKRKDVLKDIVARGHVLGNHTWWHEDLRKMTPEKASEEIVSVSDLIEEITGERPIYFRPPYGINSDVSLSIVHEQGMQSMNWSVGSEDWVYTKPEQADKIIASVMKQMHPGANILFHDKSVTVKALDPILKKLSEEGYRFVLPTEVEIKK